MSGVATKRIYFLRPIGMLGPVKIGCSCWPESRLKAVDIWSPFPLEIIATAEGGFAAERAAHWHLRDERLHGEWFSWSGRLASLVSHVQATGSLPPLEDAPYGKTKMGRGRNPSRNPEWSRMKARLTARVGLAEQWAFGSRFDCERPQRIKDLIATYQGTFTPPPEPEVVSEIEAYIGELRARPKCATTWRERWEAKRRREGLAA
jgi:hypothetical protein